MEADIKTQFKQLAKWLSQLVNILGSLPKIIINILSFLASKIKEVRYSLFASKAKGQVSKARRKTINFYRRPISDISHLSLIIVIILTLISGISGPIDIAGKVSTDPFVATKTASTAYVTSSERRLLEADSVATISSIYSDALGQDAIKEAEDLNNKINITSASSEYISSTPIVSMPENANSRSKITTYVVIDGDTLWSIARQFNLTTDTVRYANKLEDENSVKPGQTLTILPMVGLVHTVAQGDSLEGIAARYKASKELIISQNDLYGEDITPGMQLLVPDGEIPALPRPVVVPAPAKSPNNNSQEVSYVKLSTGPNHFPYGYCTWWVAQKRYIPWNGNAWQWYGNAQAYGNSVGNTPIPGAVMVTWESGVGHVAYVESVSGNSFNVSEMNYRGYGMISSRTLTTSSVPLIGFIY